MVRLLVLMENVKEHRPRADGRVVVEGCSPDPIFVYICTLYIYVMSYKISYNKYTRWCRVIQLYWLALNDYIYTQRFFLHVEVVCKLERLPFAVAPPRAFASKPNARAHRSSIISGISDFSISQSFSGFSFDLTWPYWILWGLRNTVETSRGSQAGSSCSADPHPIAKNLSIQQPQIGPQIDHVTPEPCPVTPPHPSPPMLRTGLDGGTWTTRMGWRVELCYEFSILMRLLNGKQPMDSIGILRRSMVL